MYAVKILADSIAKAAPANAPYEDDVRLTTMEVVMPRFLLAEFNTHRVFSRNSASSRAIPVKERIKQVQENPFVPEAFGKNRAGMQAAEDIDEVAQNHARAVWLQAAKDAIRAAQSLLNADVHKQHANRVLEPFAWHTVVVTSTEWANFFALRTHKAAQPEMQIVARLMRDAYDLSHPDELGVGEWHLPYIDNEDKPGRIETQIKISVSRCAAVSYERQDAEKSEAQLIERHDMLKNGAHWSPFEHQARRESHHHQLNAEGQQRWWGNFRAPWLQYRKTFEGEDVFHGE